MAGILGPAPREGRGILDIDDPASPLYGQRHGGSFVTGLIDSLGSAITLPRRVYEGSVDLNTDKGTEEVINAAGGMGLSARAMIAANPSMVPAGALGMFAGRAAKTANLEKLAQAEALAANGADARTIWDNTGWFKGADGEWRFEIDDSGTKVDLRGKAALGPSSEDNWIPLEGYMQHPKLYDAYDVGKYNTTARLDGVPQEGSFTPRFDWGYIDAKGATPEDVRSVLLHEVQHGIQHKEDFAKGGSPDGMVRFLEQEKARKIQEADTGIRGLMESSPQAASLYRKYNQAVIAKDFDAADQIEDALRAIPEGSKILELDWERAVLHEESAGDPKDAYRRLAGEVEARNVQTRRDFTPEQRRAKAPWETEDVPRDQQIIRR